MPYILAIDPGNEQSAYVLLDENLKPKHFAKMGNAELRELLFTLNCEDIQVVIEMVASYGMAVGKEVFETVFWIGRFWETAFAQYELEPERVFRKDVKLNLCGATKAKDANIRQALIDRFGPVGTKKNPGWFYGVSKDVWAAIAVGVTYADKEFYSGKKMSE